jgi:hypothetical protein
VKFAHNSMVRQTYFQATNISLSDKHIPSDNLNASTVTWTELRLQYYQSDNTIESRLSRNQKAGISLRPEIKLKFVRPGIPRDGVSYALHLTP